MAVPQGFLGVLASTSGPSPDRLDFDHALCDLHGRLPDSGPQLPPGKRPSPLSRAAPAAEMMGPPEGCLSAATSPPLTPSCMDFIVATNSDAAPALECVARRFSCK